MEAVLSDGYHVGWHQGEQREEHDRKDTDGPTTREQLDPADDLHAHEHGHADLKQGHQEYAEEATRVEQQAEPIHARVHDADKEREPIREGHPSIAEELRELVRLVRCDGAREPDDEVWQPAEDQYERDQPPAHRLGGLNGGAIAARGIVDGQKQRGDRRPHPGEVADEDERVYGREHEPV